MLQLPHIKTVGVRELQQHASSVLRRVERGETVGVTERGRLVAVLGPPSSATGTAALVSAGRVRPALRVAAQLPPAVAVQGSVAGVLDDLRQDR